MRAGKGRQGCWTPAEMISGFSAWSIPRLGACSSHGSLVGKTERAPAILSLSREDIPSFASCKAWLSGHTLLQGSPRHRGAAQSPSLSPTALMLWQQQTQALEWAWEGGHAEYHRNPECFGLERM